MSGTEQAILEFIIAYKQVNGGTSPSYEEIMDGCGIEMQYNESKYRMPKLVFWNVSARGNQTPATKDQNGVFLVSGFSAETIGKVLNAKSTTPEELMLEILNSDRYAFVDSLL